MTIRISRRKIKLGMQLLREQPAFASRMVCRWLNRLYHRRAYLSEYNESGVNVFERDWDNLLLLDACRPEMITDRLAGGEASTITSKGSDTFEFISANCREADLRDTVYVSASPILDWHAETIDQNFHDIYFVWEEHGWDDENKTVLPADTKDVALTAAETYPNKRLFVHFLQPHYPFIDAGTEFDKHQFHDPDDTHPSFWRMVETGQLQLTPEEIWELYEHNLECVLPHATELVEKLGGKSVITSDHTNMFGEPSSPIPLPEWGHPAGTYTDELVTVPWIEFEAEIRRRTVAEKPVAGKVNASMDADEARERLAELGYVK